MEELERFEQKLEQGLKSLFSKNEVKFLGFFALAFLGSAGILAAIGLLPSELKENTDSPSLVQSVQDSALGILNATNGMSTSSGYGSEFPAGITGGNGAGSGSQNQPNVPIADNRLIVPDRIMVPSLGINAVVRNPTSTSISHLDSELTKGAVRYPGSGTIGKGNMFIFGHSTGISVVQNQAYRIFNELHKVNKGDEIQLKSGETIFIYKVRSVNKVDKNDTLVKFDTASNMLTISTCDSFGSKSDRYVVEADYVGIKS